MFATDERNLIKDQIVKNFSKIKEVDAIYLVGSNATGDADCYSDLDFKIVTKEDCVRRIADKFYNELKDKTIFRKFRVDLGNEILVGMFLNNALEIDICFTSLSEFKSKNLNKVNPICKQLYKKENFKSPRIVGKKSYDVDGLLNNLDNWVWYHLKNAMFALKRNNLFRCLKEIEEARDDLIGVIAGANNVESKHYRQIDKLNKKIKNKIEKTYPKEIAYNNLKLCLFKFMQLLYETFEELGMKLQSEEYKKLFSKLAKDISL